MQLIKKIEAHIKELETATEYAYQRIADANAHLEALKAEKKALGESLKRVAKGKEPYIDEVFLSDNGGFLDLYTAFEAEAKESGYPAIEKAVTDLLEAIDEADCDRRDRQDPHHLDCE